MLEEKLKELGIEIPQVPQPLASYVPAVKSGNLIFTAGQVPMKNGQLVFKGKVGTDLSLSQATEAAKLCILNGLGAVKSEIGDLSEFEIDVNQFTNLDELKEVLEKANFGKDHTLEEVQKELGDEFDLTQTEIYSAGSWGKYTEPAIVIEGDKTQVQKVYALAEKFRQARIAVEDLQNSQSCMVETKYCEDPDKE